MPLPTILESCKADLFASSEELDSKYPAAMAERIRRIRELYNFWLSEPTMRDRQMCRHIMDVYGVSQSRAYSDIAVLHELVPLVSAKSREYHREVYREMIMESYDVARKKEDAKAMVAAATSLAKYEHLDLEEEKELPYEQIMRQPFCATTDPSVLGLKPIPNLPQYIDRLSKDLARDLADVDDVEFEEVDLEEEQLFSKLSDNDRLQDGV